MAVISPYKYKYINAGYYKSDRVGTFLTNSEKKDRKVKNGIHVFNDRESAKNHIVESVVTIKVKVNPKDFVTSGFFYEDNSSVFTKIFVSRKELDRAISVEKKRMDKLICV